MELIYLWISEYKNIKNQGFHFSPNYKVKHDIEDGKHKIKVDKNEPNLPTNFFGDKISNMTAIVGENGAGKSSLLQFLLKEFIPNNPLKLNFDYIILYKNLNKELKYVSNICIEKIECQYNIKTVNAENFKESILFYSIFTNIIPISNNSNNSGTILDYSIYNSNYTPSIYNNINAFQLDLWIKEPLTGMNNDVVKIKFKNIYIIDKETLDGFLYYPPNRFSEDDIELRLKLYTQLNAIIDQSSDDYFYESLIAYNILYGDQDINSKNIYNQICTENPNSLLSLDLTHNSPLKNNIELIKQMHKNTDDCEAEKESMMCFVKKKFIEENLSQFKLMMKFSQLSVLDLEFFKQKEIGSLKNNIEFYELSTGETLLFKLKSILYGVLSDNNVGLIILDEADMGFHPEWQRNFINTLVKDINKYAKLPVHVILTTHSPFVLSDIPKEYVLFLKKGADGTCKVEEKALEHYTQTFGANIHQLLSQSFFMQNGLMGEFVKSKVQKVIEELKKQRDIDFKYCYKIINSIGEPILKYKLQQMYNDAILRHDNMKNAQIEYYKSKIRELEGGHYEAN